MIYKMDLIQLPTAFLFYIAAALALALLRVPSLRSALSLFLPIIALVQVWNLDVGNHHQLEFFNLQLELMRVDKLSKVFGIIFCLAALAERTK